MIKEAELQKLIQAAIDVRQRAYAPYSHYPVGAALLTQEGNIYTGVNVENAVYPLTMCAERTAVFQAVAEGEQAFRAIAVVTDNGGSPCGSCRQVLTEFGRDIEVFLIDADGNLIRETSVEELLPDAFTSGDLEA
jgi:cytidine deaminase